MSIEIITILPVGTNVKLTKVASFAQSAVPVGDVIQGITSTITQIGKPIRLLTGTHTSVVNTMYETSGGDYIVTTDNSLYFLQIVK